MVVFSFSGGDLGHGCPVPVSCAFACTCLFVVFCFLLSGDHFPSELKKSMETRIKSVMNVAGGQAFSCPSAP